MRLAAPLYRRRIPQKLPKDIFALFLPINNVGNSMNLTSAARFTSAVEARWTLPIQFGMVDCEKSRSLAVDNAVIPRIYQEIPLSRRRQNACARILQKFLRAGRCGYLS